ncbi:MAG: hypothetical protein IE885_06320 [Campylobacterales bacterium]|nr:hypothetical protein [Campylobacterales bacterium]
MKKLLIASTLVLLISGCSQVGPKTKKGAIIGAASGAVVSAATGHNVVGGAVLGTAVGGTVGYLQEN